MRAKAALSLKKKTNIITVLGREFGSSIEQLPVNSADLQGLRQSEVEQLVRRKRNFRAKMAAEPTRHPVVPLPHHGPPEALWKRLGKVLPLLRRRFDLLSGRNTLVRVSGRQRPNLLRVQVHRGSVRSEL